MPRGGKRTGTPGTQYPNRSDLAQPVTVTPAKTYGDRQQAMERQQAIPLPRRVGEQVSGGSPPPTAAPPGGGGPTPGESPGGIPPGLGYHDPTARPNEPVTAGLSTGPGPGPSPTIHRDPETDALRSIYAMHPSNDLLALISKFS
jgi:hypothetical protein